MGVTNENFIPNPTITFYGGPYDGFVAEPEVEPSLDLEFPDWLKPDDCDYPYVRVCPCITPEWMVNLPQMDMFDTVYVWLPYLMTTEGDGDIPVEPTPSPAHL